MCFEIEAIRCRSHGALLRRKQPAKASMSIDLIGSALALVHVWPAGTGFVLTADLPLTDEEDEEEGKAFPQNIVGTTAFCEQRWSLSRSLSQKMWTSVQQ